MFPLDTAIRDWVLIPLCLVIFGVALLRHYATKALSASPAAAAKPPQELQSLLRGAARKAPGKDQPPGDKPLLASTSEQALKRRGFPQKKKQTELQGVRRNTLLGRSRRARAAAGYFAPQRWESRRTWLADEKKVCALTAVPLSSFSLPPSFLLDVF
jgi:hypothetical protein